MNRFEKAQEDYKKELANLDSLNFEDETLEVTIHTFGVRIINTASEAAEEELDATIETLEEE